MSRSSLQAALHAFEQQRCIVNPDVRAVRAFVPHLETDEVAELLKLADQLGRVSFIGPPLKIRGAEHVYYLTKVREEDGDKIKFTWGGVYRRKESYEVAGHVPDNWKAVEYHYRERVSNYSELAYGDELIWDRSRQVLHLSVIAPGRRTKHHYPVVTRQAVVSMRDQWIDLEPLQDRYPMPQLIEQSVEWITDNIYIAAEILGSVQPMAGFICMHCGGGLGLDNCHFCKRRVVSKKQARIDWTYPIPLGVCDRLRWMGDFETSPANAMKAYYAKWAAKDFQAPACSRQVIREPRSIVLREDEE